MKAASYMAKAGLYTALSLIFIYLSFVIPYNNTFLLTAASLIIPVSILSTNIKNSLLVFISVSILSMILFGLNSNVLEYILFFGTYGFVKLIIEKFNNRFLEYVFKLTYFNLTLMIFYIIFKKIIIALTIFKLFSFFSIIFLETAFLIYDYLLTFFITFMDNHYIKKF